MVYEFALDPEIVSEWGKPEAFRYFYNLFGLGRPRIASGFPKITKLRSMALKTAAKAGASEKELSNIIDLCNKMAEANSCRTKDGYNGENAWVENIKVAHMSQPFHGVITRKAQHDDHWLDPDKLGVEIDPLWDLEISKRFKRDGEDLSRALSGLLNNCTKVVFVDPYFAPENTRYPKAFKYLFSAVANDHKNLEQLTVEVLTGTKAPRDFFVKECKKHMPRCIPRGMNVSFKRLVPREQGEVLHNRYVLTNIGGVLVGHGLDRGSEGQTDIVSLLSREDLLHYLALYSGERMGFEIEEGPILISGTG